MAVVRDAVKKTPNGIRDALEQKGRPVRLPRLRFLRLRRERRRRDELRDGGGGVMRRGGGRRGSGRGGCGDVGRGARPQK